MIVTKDVNRESTAVAVALDILIVALAVVGRRLAAAARSGIPVEMAAVEGMLSWVFVEVLEIEEAPARSLQLVLKEALRVRESAKFSSRSEKQSGRSGP